MRQTTKKVTCACLFILLAVPCLPGRGLALDVEALIREVEKQYMGESSRALTSMQVKTEH